MKKKLKLNEKHKLEDYSLLFATKVNNEITKLLMDYTEENNIILELKINQIIKDFIHSYMEL